MLRRGLSTYLFLGVALTIALPLTVFGVLEVRRVEAASHAESERNRRLTAQSVSRETRWVAEGHIRALETLAGGLDTAEDWKAIVGLSLVTLRERYGGYDGIYAADTTGVSFAAANDPGLSLVGIDYSQRAYFQAVRETRHTVISDVEVGRVLAQPSIHVVVPVFDRAGAWVGILCGSLSLQPQSPIAQSVRGLSPSQHVAVVDRHGTLVAASQPTGLRAFTDVALFMQATREGPQLRAGPDERGIASQAVVQRLSGLLDWTVVAWQADADVEEAAVVVRRRMVAVTAVSLLLGLVVAAMMATWLGRPIRALAKVAEDFGNGTLREAPAPRAAEPAEFALLLGVFNQMLKRLHAHTEELEATVSDRTQALAATNDELAQRLAELRETQSRLGLADRMASVGTLAAGVAHEINNPLAYVVSNLEFVAEALGEPAPPLSEARAALIEARDGALRVKRIVKDLRLFSRAQDDEVEPVALAAVLESCVSMAMNEVRHRAKLEKRDGATRLALANDGQLSQVFLNLIINAAQAMPPGNADTNVLRVRSFDHVDGVAVEISDTGCGIPPEHLAKIFDPFFTTKPVGQGTGLGLAICQRLVTNVGGRIEVESTQGQGTTFRVVLPAAPGAVEPLARAVGSAPKTARRRVLVVDDETAILRSIARLIGRDHDLHTIDDAREALKRITTGEIFDVIFCDVMMPRMTGLEFWEAVRAHSPAVAARVVFLTGGAFSGSMEQRLEELNHVVLRKPFSPNDLRAAIHQLAPDPV